MSAASLRSGRITEEECKNRSSGTPSTLQCRHFELPTTFLHILVPLSLSSSCFLFFLSKCLTPNSRHSSEISRQGRGSAVCTLAIFSPCPQTGGAPFLSARKALPSAGHSLVLTSECTKFKFWLRLLWLCGPGSFARQSLNFSCITKSYLIQYYIIVLNETLYIKEFTSCLAHKKHSVNGHH